MQVNNPLQYYGQFITGEIVSGSGTSFTLAYPPISGSDAVYNGAARLRRFPATNYDYTINYTTGGITMQYSLSTGALLADYRH